MSKLDFLNRITNIILGREMILISSAQLAQVIELQEELADELAIQQSEFSLAALVVLQVFYYMRGEGDALSAEFSSPALRNEVCEKAREIWMNYRAQFPDERVILPCSSSEDLKLMQSAIDGDAESQNHISRLFESMGNQEAANYWLKEAIAMSEIKASPVPLTPIWEESHSDQYAQDSNTETDRVMDSPADKKEIPLTPMNSDAEPEPEVSAPQDATLIIEPDTAELKKQRQDALVDFFKPEEETPERSSSETIKGLEIQEEWDDAYRHLKAASPMVISTRTPGIPAVVQEVEEVDYDAETEEEEEDVFYEAQDIEIADTSFDKVNMPSVVDADVCEIRATPTNDQELLIANDDLIDDPHQKYPLAASEALNDISMTSVDAAVREIRASPTNDQELLIVNDGTDEIDHNNEKCIDSHSPETAQEQAAARSYSLTASPPVPPPVPCTLKQCPEKVEKIQIIDEEEAIRLRAIDAGNDSIERVQLDEVMAVPSSREIELQDYVKEGSVIDGESDSVEINENSAEFEGVPGGLQGEEIVDANSNYIVEAYTQQIDSLTTRPSDLVESIDDQNEVMQEQIELVPIDSAYPVEPVMSKNIASVHHPARDDKEQVSIKRIAQGDMQKAISEKNADLSIKIPVISGDSCEDVVDPTPAVVRERQPAETPSMEILPFPKPIQPTLTSSSSAITKADPPKNELFCCGLF